MTFVIYTYRGQPVEDISAYPWCLKTDLRCVRPVIGDELPYFVRASMLEPISKTHTMQPITAAERIKREAALQQLADLSQELNLGW